MTASEPTTQGPELQALRDAYAAGNHAMVRRLLSTLDPAPAAEAAEEIALLRARVEIDPVQVGVLLACLALLGAVVWSYAM